MTRAAVSSRHASAIAFATTVSLTAFASAQEVPPPPPTTSPTTPVASSAAAPVTPTTPVAPRVHRPHRDRFRNTLSLGFTAGLASPLGVLGVFLEYRPIRWASISAGAGFGGTFGASVATSLYIDPIVVGPWALGVGGSYAHDFSYVSGVVVPGRPAIPSSTNWLSVELETQIRPTRGVFLRIGAGRAFLLDTQAFNIASVQELEAANLPVLPVSTPIDAMYAAARGQDFGMWFIHLDVAPTWQF